MGWLWENYRPDVTFAAESRPASPYIEAEGGEQPGKRWINPLPRFRSIFLPLFAEETLWRNLPRQFVENLFFHVLARLDLLSGINMDYLARQKLASQLENGDYGEKARQLFVKLSADSKETICFFLLRQQQEKSRRLFFLDCFYALFPKSAAYYYSANDVYLFYIAKNYNESDNELIMLLEELFWDINCPNRKYYWNSHVGIIGNNQTMRIGQIRIY